MNNHNLLLLSFVISAFVLSFGLSFSHMTEGTRARGFFKIPPAEDRAWDPALGFAFAGALFSHILFYVIAKKMMKEPILSCSGAKLSFPKETKAVIDVDLISGSLLFGVGWSLGGFCPGPAILSAASAVHSDSFVFVSAMLVGMSLALLRKTLLQQTLHLSYRVFLFFSVLGLITIAFLSPPFHGHSAFELEALITSSPPPLYQHLFGGVLIGSAAGILLLLSGSTMGISGIVSDILRPEISAIDRVRRVAFLVTMLITTKIIVSFYPVAFATGVKRPFFYGVLGGLLVGYGTVIGNGCTSGHGICGMSRLSVRSIAATMTFMASHALSLFVFSQMGLESF